MNKIFFPCVCEGEGITIDLWKEEKFVLIAFWDSYNNSMQLSLIERLKWAWRLICKGQVYGDQMLLDRGTAIALGKSIIAHAEKLKSNNG